MFQVQQRTASLGKFLVRMAKATMRWLALDVTETKWGHRVMDQVFREGKFHPGPHSEQEQSHQRTKSPNRNTA